VSGQDATKHMQTLTDGNEKPLPFAYKNSRYVGVYLQEEGVSPCEQNPTNIFLLLLGLVGKI